jgi:LysM repeat protein
MIDILLAVLLLCPFYSCDDVKEYPWNDAWDQTEQETPEDSENTDSTEEPSDPETPGDSEDPETPQEPETPEEPDVEICPAGGYTYEVKAGDTLARIAAFYQAQVPGITWQQIARFNNLYAPYTLTIGQTLRIPCVAGKG